MNWRTEVRYSDPWSLAVRLYWGKIERPREGRKSSTERNRGNGKRVLELALLLQPDENRRRQQNSFRKEATLAHAPAGTATSRTDVPMRWKST
jgi:hypothetical protein